MAAENGGSRLTLPRSSAQEKNGGLGETETASLADISVEETAHYIWSLTAHRVYLLMTSGNAADLHIACDDGLATATL